MQTDRFDLPLSTDNELAAAGYIENLDHFLAYRPSIDGFLQTLEHDPNFALAHIGLARSYQVRGKMDLAKASAIRARELAESITKRERQHVEVVALAILGKAADAATLLADHAKEFPRDALPISMALGALGFFAFSGKAGSREAERSFLEQLAPHWHDDWWFDMYLGWAYVETGLYEKGVALIDGALAKDTSNALGAHVRAHGYYEMGETDQGTRFLQQWLADNDDSALLHPHITWHLALFALQTGDTDQAKAVYENTIAPAVSKAAPLLVMMDAASFAWRCKLYGQSLTQAQYEEVAAQARECLPKAGPAFFNLHKAMALACVSDEDGLNNLGDQVNGLVQAGKQPPGDAITQICSGLAHCASADFAKANQVLTGVHQESGRLGGSSAQQDFLLDSLIASSIAAGDDATAQALTEKRSTLRASHLGPQWLANVAPALQA
jgi:Tfp pilus assembly protein PilF